MADLSYSDVQRAVQDGLQNMRADVQRLSNQISVISQQSQLIDAMNTRLARLEGQTRRHDPRSEQGTAQLARDVQELKARFIVVEKFCTDMSKYAQIQIDKDLENKQYRAV
jgi:hypothetical protein